MEKINPEMLRTEDLLKIYDHTKCFFCHEPLTSDDFKLDRIEKTKSFIAHTDCVTKALVHHYILKK